MDAEAKRVISDLARKRLYFRCMIVCGVLAIVNGWAAFLLPSPAGWSGVEPFAFAAEPYSSLFILLLLLSVVFFLLYARH